MVELSLLERFKITLDLVFSSPLFLVLLIGIVLMLLQVLLISKKSRGVKLIYLIGSLIIISLLVYKYLGPVINVFNTIFKNIVTLIYFPSVLEYIMVLLVSLIIVLVSTFSKKTGRIVKFINLLVFSINIFNFFLILDQISKANIDLSSKVSIYSNEVLMALFELSLIIFVIWIIGLIIYKIIRSLSNKGHNDNFYEEPELPKTIEELRKEELTPPPQIEYIVVEKKNDNDMFTLDEYRQMKKVLEYIKEVQENNKTIDE